MLLTFEYDNRHNTLAIFFDREGRDELIESLKACNNPGDHDHLFSGAAACPGNRITLDRYLADHRAVEEVHLGIPGAGMKPITDKED